jgi:hypothetical protein
MSAILSPRLSLFIVGAAPSRRVSSPETFYNQDTIRPSHRRGIGSEDQRLAYHTRRYECNITAWQSIYKSKETEAIYPGEQIPDQQTIVECTSSCCFTEGLCPRVQDWPVIDRRLVFRQFSNSYDTPVIQTWRQESVSGAGSLSLLWQL